ncbi:Two pore domain potassium channel [Parasponia andersonii]|uniref:Two pore domain potassium channel n=1 Tax=Parasponia andersonii TaxID=3476 RepID=A0A2P5ANK9_PARAD|nr:Two pore domain potassium channel [Parasponia andersonii]
MTTDDHAKEALLSTTKDHSQLKEKTVLQRIRSGQSSSTCTNTVSAESNRLEQTNGAEDFASALDSMDPKKPFSLKQVAVVLATYLGGGTLCFFLIRNQIKGQKTNDILDAIYFCVVTMTTVGYGDLVPITVLAKLLASIYVFTGMVLGGLILGKVADYIVEKQEVLLVRAVHVSEKVWPAELLKEVETSKVKYKFVTAAAQLLVLIIAGTVFLHTVEHLELMDAFYCVCSTITTLGYGDESFSTRTGRVFAVFWILGSTICLAQFFIYLAELFTESRQRSLVKWVLNRRLTSSELEAADFDQDKVVSAAEFVLYKLKEMGKISQEDISVLMEMFKNFDIDKSGTLTPADLVPFQST